MDLEKLAAEAAGAFAAEKGLEAADPSANFLEKGAAVVAGFAGGGGLESMLTGKAADAPADDAQPAADDSSDSDNQ